MLLIDEVRSILPKNEPLTPGILYIGVAGLAGSVMARNREYLVAKLHLRSCPGDQPICDTVGSLQEDLFQGFANHLSR